MRGPDAASAALAGYVLASAVVLSVLVVLSVWVGLGHGFPGGSVLRRGTGLEGPTGGLTTAMRMMLRGDFAQGAARHPAAAAMLAYLGSQIGWRTCVVLWRPAAPRVWSIDLTLSLVLLGGVIYVPWFC